MSVSQVVRSKLHRLRVVLNGSSLPLIPGRGACHGPDQLQKGPHPSSVTFFVAVDYHTRHASLDESSLVHFTVVAE